MSKPAVLPVDTSRVPGQPAKPALVLVVARARNGVIGRDNGLPWHLPDDLRHFKALTLGKPILMGRRTFESIGRPLPGRQNLVLSRDPAFRPDGVTVVHDLEAALAAAGAAPELMVIGGADLYRQVLSRATRIELTEVDGDVAGDTRLDAFAAADWVEVSRTAHPADARHAWPYSFVTLERRPTAGRVMPAGTAAAPTGPTVASPS